MPTRPNRTSVPVVVDPHKCIAAKGCRVCVDSCPLDLLAIDTEKDCPTGAIHVDIPYLLR
jgi:ferredoxin